jgi:hypothetical protein
MLFSPLKQPSIFLQAWADHLLPLLIIDHLFFPPLKPVYLLLPQVSFTLLMK